MCHSGKCLLSIEPYSTLARFSYDVLDGSELFKRCSGTASRSPGTRRLRKMENSDAGFVQQTSRVSLVMRNMPQIHMEHSGQGPVRYSWSNAWALGFIAIPHKLQWELCSLLPDVGFSWLLAQEFGIAWLLPFWAVLFCGTQIPGYEAWYRGSNAAREEKSGRRHLHLIAKFLGYDFYDIWFNCVGVVQRLHRVPSIRMWVKS